jgi:hypothetical protein
MKIITTGFSKVLYRCTKYACIIFVAALVMPVNLYSQTTVDLKSASSFAALAAAGIVNTGNTVLTGDIGSYPTTTISGFPPGVFSGTNHAGDAVTQAAMLDLASAYTDAAGRTVTATLPTELSGATLNAGVYNSVSGTFNNTGALILDGQNNANAVFIFKMATTLITDASSSITLINGAVWTNVFWQVGSSATLGASSTLEGTILAHTSITVNNSATLHGHLFAGAIAPSGALTIDNGTTFPVELTTFTAALRDKIVELNWITATEINNYGFIIQRSQALKADVPNYNWTKVAFVKGAGYSNSQKNYTYDDNSVSYGGYVYRLKQLDNNGDFKYSAIVEVSAGQIPNGFLLNQNYPNPFNPSTQIQFGVSKNTNATITLYNIIGEKISVLFNGNVLADQVYNVTVNGSNLAGGVYFYKLDADKRSEVKKMLLLK